MGKDRNAGWDRLAESSGRATAEGAPSPRLVKAAHEFEGQMMKELLKPMTGGDALTAPEDDRIEDAGSAARWASLPPRRWDRR